MAFSVSALLLFALVVVSGQVVRSADECSAQCTAQPSCGSGSMTGWTCSAAPPASQTCAQTKAVMLYKTNGGAVLEPAFAVADAAECTQRCIANPSCNAVTLTADYKLCYLKSGVGPMTSQADANTAIVNRAGAKCVVIADSQVAGASIADYAATTKDQCCDKCVLDSNCKSFVWLDNHCYLKAAQSDVSTVFGTWSGFPMARVGF